MVVFFMSSNFGHTEMRTSAKINFRGETICDDWSIKVQNHQGLKV